MSGGSAGVTLLELVVALALLALAVGIGVAYLGPLEAPLETAGELFEGLLRQTRAKAMATTSVYRVRPQDDIRLAIERSDRCSSSSWTEDSELSFELPGRVKFADTGWTVCFTSRGIASENLILTLEHPDDDARQLEVLNGGTLRWIE